MDGELAELDQLLEDEKLLILLESDLSQRYRRTTKTGRHSTPVEVILRMLTLKHLRNLSYKQTVQNVKESLVLRQFCRVYLNPVPCKSTLIRWSKLIKPSTLKQFNLSTPQAQRLVQILSKFIPRIEQVITQTCRRVFGKEKVPATEKLLSLFEAHTDIICRGKLNRRVEFGHKVWLCEVDGGLISDYRLLCGNPHDTFQWKISIETHIEQFGRAPTLASADRGVYSQSNETIATQKGVKRVILPKSGYKSKQRQQQEKQRSFRRGRYWHNGVEGRISVLKRCYGLRRCLFYGEIGFERWLGWSVIAANLAVMGRTLATSFQRLA